MMIKLYGTHCPKCNVIEKKLLSKNIEFEMIDDPDKVVEFGHDHNLNSAPIIELEDGSVLDFVGANKLLNSY